MTRLGSSIIAKGKNATTFNWIVEALDVADSSFSRIDRRGALKHAGADAGADD
jgi:hypothetical protein